MRTPTVFIPRGEYDTYVSHTKGLRGFLEFSDTFTTIGTDAAPIYTGITIVRSGIGTREITSGGSTTTQSINYSQSHTFDRVLITDLSLEFAYSPFSDGPYDDFYPIDEPTDEQSLFSHYIFGTSRANSLLANPKKHHLHLSGLKYFSDFVYGTQVIDSDPSTDLVTLLSITCPRFYYNDPFPNPPDVLPNEFDQWNCLIGADLETPDFGIDVTGYSGTKWRDLRGNYTLEVDDVDIDSSWDTNSVVHTVEWTIF